MRLELQIRRISVLLCQALVRVEVLCLCQDSLKQVLRSLHLQHFFLVMRVALLTLTVYRSVRQ